MFDVKCEICLAIIDSDKLERRLYNVSLYDNKTFRILPSVGPLVQGQAIIVSKIHSLNLLDMAPIERLDLIPFIEYSKEILGDNILFAEHGALLEQTGGSCINHTHLHVIPGFGHHFEILDTVLPIFDTKFKIEDLYKIERVDCPYILTFNSEGGFRLYKAFNAHSQMVRKAICLREGRTDWDWKKKHEQNLIEQTIEMWQKKLKKK